MSAALMVSAVITFPSYGGNRATAGGGYQKAYDAASRTAAAMAKGQQTISFSDGSHVHLNGATIAKDGHLQIDPATKNAIARGATTVDSDTADPTTPQPRCGPPSASAAGSPE